MAYLKSLYCTAQYKAMANPKIVWETKSLCSYLQLYYNL